MVPTALALGQELFAAAAPLPPFPETRGGTEPASFPVLSPSLSVEGDEFFSLDATPELPRPEVRELAGELHAPPPALGEGAGERGIGLVVETFGLSKLDHPLEPNVREAKLLTDAPWVRALGRLELSVTTEGWKFPAPPAGFDSAPRPATEPRAGRQSIPQPALPDQQEPAKPRIRPKPTADTVFFKDRLLYLLQPPLDSLFDGRQLEVPFEPYPYQLEGIAFLMPRHHALIADEMGLGKTAQAILSLRLLFHSGEIKRGLVVCPKPLMHNWARELKMWAPDVPFEAFEGDPEQRRSTWLVSNCPLKLINYETLTRDCDLAADARVQFDVVVLDEAQRIKNKESKTALVVRGLNRGRSWALTGTPIENHPDDLVNIFSFVAPGRIPAETPAKRIPQYTSDLILRRTKDDVLTDMPPKVIRDLEVELTPAQRAAYVRAENDGVIQLNALGDTITVQHVFQLVMRLKQICNFDPLTGESAKLVQLLSDMEEVAESGRKAIIFSQWVEPLEVLAKALAKYGPLQYHGKIPQPQRTPILDRFKSDPSAHVLLMSYGTGSVGLNLQFTNYVFLFDRWWNPAIEDQAINRAHRLGQKHPVTVTRFLSGGTIEGRIADILDAKRKVFNDLIAQADKPASLGLSEDDIFGLFDIKARPKRDKH
ncbi:ATP-dependent helicase HepA [Gemmata obscuriglobus]|nr:ATP-dependent helicase HepA [Gemmata obscuriglobus]VTS10475.1 non-specific serine threonine protein kinase : Swi/snf family protein OS=Blastopirellula marina DSM 3645 GN=DSM3645_16475 PE=4 SV=1: SNF2_N: Helicase_C [Gemmata obscuriglobus UQM 2246]